MTDSYWKIPKIETLKLPIVILREQAAALTQETNGLLRGDVEAINQDNKLHIYLNVIVPALDNYKVTVLSYEQPIHLYPGKINSQFRTGPLNVGSLNAFTNGVKIILSSDRVQQVIAGLMAQAQQG